MARKLLAALTLGLGPGAYACPGRSEVGTHVSRSATGRPGCLSDR